MSLRNRFVLMSVLATLAVLMGCSSTHKAAPPPTGGFSDTNLNGTYVFSTTGSDLNGNFLTMVGTFTACGCTSGTISAGVVDMNDPAFSAPVAQLAITGGSYHVGVDGRGTASLTAATPFGNSIGLDFVLSSSQGGLVTEFDGNGSGSGTLDLQSSARRPNCCRNGRLFLISGAFRASASPLDLESRWPRSVRSRWMRRAIPRRGVQDLNNDAAPVPHCLLTIATSSISWSDHHRLRQPRHQRRDIQF